MHRIKSAAFCVCLSVALTPAAKAIGIDDFDPTDFVPRQFAVDRFAELSMDELYKVNLAVKRGRTIRIGTCSPSQSREIIKASLENRAPALDLAQSACKD